MRSLPLTWPRLAVVQNLQQGVKMHSNERPSGWQRRLRFESEEIWNELPEPVREQCRTLWRQLLTEVVKPAARRQNERED